ncbi:hypothetical protein JKP88DRAFT_264656 [Tribonema minus]|uniref:Uncharacterized protein n=1 Tax=Tribonema minus TaxID=303371 RepID=A0A835YP45_9STRA|nr:hypothetical protein JKP88DRAFT_264656 [Tribonema minus]
MWMPCAAAAPAAAAAAPHAFGPSASPHGVSPGAPVSFNFNGAAAPHPRAGMHAPPMAHWQPGLAYGGSGYLPYGCGSALPFSAARGGSSERESPPLHARDARVHGDSADGGDGSGGGGGGSGIMLPKLEASSADVAAAGATSMKRQGSSSGSDGSSGSDSSGSALRSPARKRRSVQQAQMLTEPCSGLGGGSSSGGGGGGGVGGGSGGGGSVQSGNESGSSEHGLSESSGEICNSRAFANAARSSAAACGGGGSGGADTKLDVSAAQGLAQAAGGRHSRHRRELLALHDVCAA